VSAHVSEQTIPYYVGTLNGVMYRIRPDALAPGGKHFALEPFEGPRHGIAQPADPTGLGIVGSAAPDLAAQLAAPLVPVAADAPVVALSPADRAKAERDAAAVKLFKREGAEPLRAGHPDLWALLVRGTCLEGTTFQAATGR
jgi:hypothetical protein